MNESPGPPRPQILAVPRNRERGADVSPGSAQHSAVNETLCRDREAFLKQSRLTFVLSLTSIRERGMRTLVFGVILLAVAAAGFHTLISSSLAAARDSKAATFSERFAPVLKNN
jgi:hypothetical protein